MRRVVWVDPSGKRRLSWQRTATAGALWAMLGIVFGGCGRPGEQPQPPSPTVAEPAAAGPQVITTKDNLEMVLIPGGKFLMGDNQGDDDEKPAHRVQISSFYMDRCEVTQQSYRSLMGDNPAKFSGPDRPVERVSWFAAIRYCNMRSLREGLKPCYDLKSLQCDFDADGYRLPTEAEWEYACRAGTATRYYFGNDASRLGSFAWFKGNSGRMTHPVKQKAPNPWGLYDMHGNVAEWCQDFASEDYRQHTETFDPRGPKTGQERVLRGGSWSSSEDACRCSARASAPPGFADVCFGYEAYGFRCVRRASPDPQRQDIARDK